MAFENQIRELKTFNTVLRSWLEEAELKVPTLNEQIARIHSTGVIGEAILLGNTIFERYYSEGTGPHDSGQILRAAIIAPGGCGLTLWDTEEYASLCQNDGEIERHARQRFVAYTELSLGERALLARDLPSLISNFQALVQPIPAATRPVG